MRQRGQFKAADRKWRHCACVLQRVEGADATTVREFRGENAVNCLYGLKYIFACLWACAGFTMQTVYCINCVPVCVPVCVCVRENASAPVCQALR